MNTIAEAEHALAPYLAIARETRGEDITTKRALELSRAVGSPHERLKVIHVAGTSGKTSTSYFISRLLASTGVSVGLAVSPHIRSITERLQIDNEPLNESVFCEYLSEFLHLVERSGHMPSYFELMMVFALWVFDKRGLDYVVLETGLGGLHDSSNICTRGDKVCVITDIGLDHTRILGETLSEIAVQKAGIIAANNHVLMHEQSTEVVDEVKRSAGQCDAKLVILPTENDKTYQTRNSRLAHAIARYIAKRDNLNLAQDALLGLDMKVPGRMQILKRGATTIILDGAHNEQKTAALVSTLKNEYPNQKFTVVVAMRDTKDYESAIVLLSTIASSAIATRLHSAQGATIRSVDPELIQLAFERASVSCVTSSSVHQAVESLLRQAPLSRLSSNILVTGSLGLDVR